VSFILIGNFIFLNLFLAVLIDSFLKEGETSATNKQKEEDEQLKQDEMTELLKSKRTLRKQPSKTSSSMFVKRGTVTQPIAEIMIKRLKAIINHNASETTI